uniref:Importin-13 n=1 Tax=Strigamia maritima TaxID=126957 RepID=T1JBC7_STRMM
MNFTAESVEKAVYQFYLEPAQVHQWLTLAQESPEAWKSELTEEQCAELKIKLIRHIVAYISQGPRIILTRLCIALSSFIIRTIPTLWNTAIIDVISVFQVENLPEVPPEKSISALLQILTVLTEEFQTMILAQSFRVHVRRQFNSNTDQVLSLIQQTLLKSNDVSLSLHALNCFQKWIQFGISIPDCTKLIDLVFNIISIKEFCEAGSDIIQSIVYHPESHKYPDSILELLKKVLQLENLLLIAVQQKDLDICSTLCGLFTAIGETHTRLFLEVFLKDDSAKENFLKLVKIILACTGAPGQYPIDETFSYVTFAFWYNLQDEIISADKKNSVIFRSYFTSIFESLVDTLLQKRMSPRIKSGTWSADEIEQFRCYREDIGDTFMYCYNLLRTKMLERLLNHINNVLIRAKSNKDEFEQALEVCLSAFQSVADSVDTDENIYVPQFLSQLLNIPFQDNPYILASAIDAVGAYAEWINCNPNALSQIIPLILMGLNEPGAASSATLALSDISRDCQLNMRPFAESILTVCEEVFVKHLLKQHEEVRLMYSVGYAGSLLSPEVLLNYLKKLLTPVFVEMQNLSQKQELTAVEQSTLISRLKLLSTLFHTLNIKLKEEDPDGNVKIVTQQEENVSIIQPVLPILEEFLPVLKQIVTRWPLCAPLTDAVCEVLKRAVTNLLDDVLPALRSILQFLNVIYTSFPSVAALNLYKMIALIFFDNEDQKMVVQNTLVLIVNKTLAISQTGGLSNNSDICETFCQLLGNLIKKLPTCLLHNEINLLLLFQYGVAVIAIPEAPAVKSASIFMVNFINQSRDYPSMLHVINNYGHVLLTQILTSIGGLSPRGVMDSVTDVLTAMLKKYFDNTTRWLHSITTKENFPAVHINKMQKEEFVNKILKDYSNKRKLQEHVKTFSLLCRGLIGTEYANQILPSL